MNFFKDLNITVKLIGAFLIVVVIFVFVTGFQINAMQRLGKLEETAALRSEDALALSAIDSRLESLYSVVGDLIINHDVKQGKADFAEAAKQAEQDMEKVQSMADTEEERTSAAIFVNNYYIYLDLIELELIPYVEKGDTDQVALQAINTRATALRDAAIEPLAALAEELVQEQVKASQNYADIQKQTITYSLALTGAGVALALLLAVIVSLAISRPLKKSARYALAVADGDIDGDLPVRQRDEVGEVAWALRRAAESLRNVLGQFEEATERISQGHLRERADATQFKGAFANLVQNGNRLADTLVGFLDDVPAPLMAIDTDFNIMFMNKAGAEVGGTDPLELAGTSCRDYFKTSDCRTENCACDKAMRSRGSASSETDAHPGVLDLEISYVGVPIVDRNGQVVGAFEIVQDQTDIVRAKQKMERLAEQSAGISERLSSAAEELSAQVEQSSRGAEIQRDRVAESATAMEEMTATVMEVAKNASQASSNADRTRDFASNGVEKITTMVEAINLVKNQTDTLKQNMAALGEQAEDIGRIMNVISDIADQTNLLALNAAIEAARAGEAGRGFAVVADEVRKLAEKTMNATKEVGDAITSIQTVTRENIQETDKAAEAVAESTEMAGDSGETLNRILTMAESTADQVQAIAAASEEQSATTEQINRTTEEINRISAETSDAMAQSSSAIMELARLAGNLQEIIKEMNS